jgi:hypothetical protein
MILKVIINLLRNLILIFILIKYYILIQILLYFLMVLTELINIKCLILNEIMNMMYRVVDIEYVK